ncbi:hypothetical protein [Thermodesulfovibrio sp. Kuro-1]|uniref:hypothetical protein n=1 Tax=Thermodesulfovibrio sp. Kuro-1 TaxID=2580394 RepID=UPI0011416269|nr:hypothetical protein [Thermodesulfovibrio sp. Kuro-1]
MEKFKILKLKRYELEKQNDFSVDYLTCYSLKNENSYILKIYNQPNYYNELYENNLLEKLNKAKLIPPTEYVKVEFDNGQIHYGFLQKRIFPMTYPFEWTPSMLKDAANKILEIVELTNTFGFTLKDAHPYNLVFDESFLPLWIDLGSFIRIDINSSKEKIIFPSYPEFYALFYAPLLLAQEGLVNISKTLYSVINYDVKEILILVEKKLRYFSVFPNKIKDKLVRYYLNYKYVNMVNDSEILKKLDTLKFRYLLKTFFYILKMFKFPFALKFHKLRKEIEEINFSFDTAWFNYYDKNKLDHEIVSNPIALMKILPPRFIIISDIIKKIGVKEVIDLGGNIGLLGFYLMKQGIVKKYINIDTDVGAIDFCYNIIKKLAFKNFYCVNSNYFIPSSPSLFKSIEERFRSECVVVLALTHHLILSQKLNISYILDKISKLTEKYVLIEFMPLGLWDGKQAPPTPDFYNINWFRSNFLNYFKVLEERVLEENRILFVGYKK